MRTFYIAGPMRGIKDFNFPAFDLARDYLVMGGHKAISPADLDRAAEPGKWADDHVFTEEEVASIVDRDTKAISSLRASRGDGIVLLEGWENSTGARAEVAIALWRKLPLYEFYTYDGVAYIRRVSIAVSMKPTFGGREYI